MARNLTTLLVLAWIGTTPAVAGPPSTPTGPAQAPASTPAPTSASPGESGTPIFLDTPASLDAFLAKIPSPDFVLLRGDRYQTLLKAANPLVPAGKPAAPPSITRVTIGGTAGAKTAELQAEFEVFNDDAQPRWVPIRLDGAPVGRVSEAGQLLPVRGTAATGLSLGSWEVEIRGAGRHLIEVALTAAVVTNGEERRLDLAIPLAATTMLNLTLNETPIEASLGGHDPIIPQKLPDRAGGKIAVAMTPRNRLILTWRVPLEQAIQLPPRLSAQGEMAVDITADAIRTRARWSITAVRGTTRTLQFTIDPDEDLIDLDLDNRALALDTITLGPNRLLVIDLPDPLRQGSLASNVTFTTRRKLPARDASTVRLKGFALAGATLQTGAIALTQNGSIWLEGTGGRGLVRIDPADDLPTDLRSRPGTILAYRFVEQPFDLALKIEPAPPTLESRAKSSITVLPDQVSVESEFHLRSTPREVFSVQFRVPADLKLDLPQANENVESARLSPEVVSDPGEHGDIPKRLLNVRLTSHARDTGVFTIKLVASRQGWGKTSPTLLGLIEPVGATSLGGRVAIHRAVGVGVDLFEPAGKPAPEPVFLHAFAPSAADWTLPPPSLAGIEPAPLWLTYEGTPSSLPLRLTRHPRSVRAETEVRAKVRRDGIDYRAAVSLDVLNGLLGEFEVIVPADVDRSWELEGVEIARRELVETLAGGARRYRLRLAKGEVKRLDIRFRYRTTFATPLPTNADYSGRFERLRVLPEGEGASRFAFEAEPGIAVRLKEAGWTPRLAPIPSDSPREIGPGSISYVSRNSLELSEFTARAESLVALPPLVISRAILSTLVGSDELRTTATMCFEVHGPDVVFELPPDARWIQAQVNGQTVAEVVKVGDSSRYRIVLPAGSGTILAVDYASPSRSKTAWTPPAVETALWQTVYWNVIVPNTYAVLGVPGGWTDQNEWYWDHFIWMRKPVLAAEDLRAWLSGAARPRGLDEFAPGAVGHSYLFRRTDGPRLLPIVTVSRVLLLAVCSGSIGLFGIGLVVARPAIRGLIIPCAIGCFILGIGWDPNITLQVVQSGTLGAAMAVIASLLQRFIDRRNGRSSRVVDASASLNQAPQRTTSLIQPVVGPDDSTAIRARTQLSGDRILITPPPRSVSLPSESGLEP